MFTLEEYYNNSEDWLANPEELQIKMESYTSYPEEITEWLSKLQLLRDVPLNYLVADENMLPPESIRFFYVDPNWIQALTDGALSIGRNISKETTQTASMSIEAAFSKKIKPKSLKTVPSRNFQFEKALTQGMINHSRQAAFEVRKKYLGLQNPETKFSTASAKTIQSTSVPIPDFISGFLLRSLVVRDFPGLGVKAYAQGQEPSGSNPGTCLDIIRLERLSSESDTIICFIGGDPFQVDIHEAPEALHYGIDTFSTDNGSSSGSKTVYHFTKNNNNINLGTPQTVNLNSADGGVFRSGDSRTLNMAILAEKIATGINKSSIDASEMGFEMTEEVGMISFKRQN